MQKLNNFTAAELEQFRRDGYVISRRLADEPVRQAMLDATLDGLNNLIEPLEFEADLHYPGAPQSRTEQGGDTVRRLKQAYGRGSSFTDWVNSPKLVGRLQQLLGPQLVMPLAHHNCVMTKNPRYSSNTGWHQDIRYWSFARPDLVSVWLALGREFPENGCLKLIPGSHAMDLDRSRFDDELFFRHDLPVNQKLIASSIYAELEPGDALFFHCRTLHAANNNTTSQPKFSVVFTFRPKDNPSLPGSRSSSLPELPIT